MLYFDGSKIFYPPAVYTVDRLIQFVRKIALRLVHIFRPWVGAHLRQCRYYRMRRATEYYIHRRRCIYSEEAQRTMRSRESGDVDGESSTSLNVNLNLSKSVPASLLRSAQSERCAAARELQTEQ